MASKVICGDCLKVMREIPDDSVDLVFCSPPYEAARTYGIDFDKRGEEWAEWAHERFIECLRVSKGLVAWVVEGQTRQFRYSAAPVLLMANLHRAGVHLRKPPIFHRVGIPGSGGPDWLRNDYEFIVCATGGGKLPWSDNTACGHTPKWAPGGEMSHRQSDGTRRNQWGGSASKNGSSNERKKNGSRSGKPRPSHVLSTVWSMREKAVEPKALAFINGDMPPGSKLHTKSDGDAMRVPCYTPPSKANPGNEIQETYTAEQVGRLVMELIGEQSSVQRHKVGGGLMGSKLSHENEAPFPVNLAAFFVKSFCPPGGTVLDPFGGSGTTLQAAIDNGRNGIAIDIRQGQCDLMHRRIAEAVGLFGAEEFA